MSDTKGSASARERVDALLDENSFVEIGALVTARNTDFNMQKKETPSDGVITGYGLIEGSLVYVYSQDVSVLNGSIGEMHAKKITGIYDMAMKMGAPVIGLLDSSGFRLQESTDALHAFGEIYLKQSLASGIIPQIAAIFGTCGGGLSVIPTLTDFTFMEEKKAKLFVNAPNVIDGNETSKSNTASADFQSGQAGIVDFVGEENTIFTKIRELITILPANNEEEAICYECSDALNRACPDLASNMEDAAFVLTAVSDDHFFMESKSNYAKEIVTGFIKLNGVTVGAVANRTKIYDSEKNVTSEFEPRMTYGGCEKAADFITFCDAFHIPVLSLTNVIGYRTTTDDEKHMAKAAARLAYAFACASVPKVNVITGQAFGSAYIQMNSKGIGADIVYAWKDAKIGMMDAEQAVRIMYAEEIKSSKDKNVMLHEKAEAYEALQNSVESAARRGYVDCIIAPEYTRKYLIGAFEMLYTKNETRSSKKYKK